MYPPCLVFTENVLTDLRTRVAHSLHDNGFTQAQIAHHLHVSQAMVSKYLRQEVEPSPADEVAAEIARMITRDTPQQDIILYLCQTCFTWRENGILCRLHNLEPCTVCTKIRSPEVMDEKRQVINNLKEALRILENPLVLHLMPEVRMNIAMSLRNASNPMEVASIPGRLIPLHGRATAVSTPEFGASHHLASILLKTGKRAVINIKYTREIDPLFKKAGLTKMTEGEPGDVLIDKGGFGIEPCAYVFGEDAVDAAFKVLRIAERL